MDSEVIINNYTNYTSLYHNFTPYLEIIKYMIDSDEGQTNKNLVKKYRGSEYYTYSDLIRMNGGEISEDAVRRIKDTFCLEDFYVDGRLVFLDMSKISNFSYECYANWINKIKHKTI